MKNLRVIACLAVLLMVFGSFGASLCAAPQADVRFDLQGPQTISLNNASAAELQMIKGIGPALAERIVAYRNEHGPFKQVDDLTAVRGIGQAKLEKMKTQLRL